MTEQLSLLAELGPQPLPTSWDGRQVTWGSWEMPPRMFICPPPKHVPCCPGCGSQADRSVAYGKVDPLPGEMFDSEEVRKLGSGREYIRPVQVPAWRVMRLLAYRCPECRHAEVVDLEGLRA